MNKPERATEPEPAMASQPEAPAAPRSRGRPRLADVAAIDNQLLAAALTEFVRCGFGGASMRGISKAANVSRTTLFARYSSKEDLFRAIMTQQVARMAAASTLPADGAPDLAAGLIAYGNRALGYSLEGELLEINRLITSTAGQFPEVAAAAAEATGIGIAQIAAFIARCGEADGLPCRDPQVPAECFILLLRGWHGRVMLGGVVASAQERERWVEAMVRTLIAGRAAW